MQVTRYAWAILLVGLAAGKCLAQVDAVTTARYDLELGFTVPGKVEKLLVKPGDAVETGQLLIQLEDKEGVSIIERLRVRLSSDAEVQARAAKHKLSKLQEDRLRELVKKDAAAPFELQSAEVQTEIARLEVEIAQQGMDELKKQLEQAEARHEQFLMRAPSSGTIEVVMLEIGEIVEDVKPVLRLVDAQVLRVDAAVPTAQTLTLKPGDPAWVKSKMPGFEQPTEGKIVFIAKVADAASDTRLVRVEIVNTQGLPAGGQVTVWFNQPGTQVSQVDAR